MSGPEAHHRQYETPIWASPGTPARSDYEYLRCGTANLFVCVEPLRGYRHIIPTDRRTKKDYARIIQRRGSAPLD